VKAVAGRRATGVIGVNMVSSFKESALERIGEVLGIVQHFAYTLAGFAVLSCSLLRYYIHVDE
jgi:hypothetical protein